MNYYLCEKFFCMINSFLKKDIPIRYYDAGKGETLVFLHGYLESMEIWEDFSQHFESDYRVIRIDLPGHGGSGIVHEVSGMNVMAGVVKEVLSHVGVERAVIIGHSMGGYTALAALELYPEIFKAILLFHSHTLADSREIIKKRNREINIIEKGLKRLLVNQNIPNMYGNDNLDKFQDAVQFSKAIAHRLSDEGVIAAIRGLKSRSDSSSVLEHAKMPCLNIIGRNDNYIPFEDVSLQTKLPVGSSQLILEKSGHMGFIEESEKAREGILQFLNKIG